MTFVQGKTVSFLGSRAGILTSIGILLVTAVLFIWLTRVSVPQTPTGTVVALALLVLPLLVGVGTLIVAAIIFFQAAESRSLHRVVRQISLINTEYQKGLNELLGSDDPPERDTVIDIGRQIGDRICRGISDVLVELIGPRHDVSIYLFDGESSDISKGEVSTEEPIKVIEWSTNRDEPDRATYLVGQNQNSRFDIPFDAPAHIFYSPNIHEGRTGFLDERSKASGYRSMISVLIGCSNTDGKSYRAIGFLVVESKSAYKLTKRFEKTAIELLNGLANQLYNFLNLILSYYTLPEVASLKRKTSNISDQ